MMSPEQKKELYLLLHALCEDQITDQQFAQLDEILQSSQEAREIYVDIRNLWSDLRYFQASLYSHGQETKAVYEDMTKGTDFLTDSTIWEALSRAEKESPAIELPKKEPERELIQKVVYPPREKRKISKFSIFTLVNVAALLLFFVFLRYLPPKGVEIATLNDSINARWGNHSGLMEKGTRLVTRSDELFSLQEGLAELLFDNNTKVLIEGPAEFQLLSEDRIDLQFGRIYATVPPEATGFSVYTPNAKIIDLGTEFGVKAEIDGNTQLQVFKGKTMLLYGTHDTKYSMEVSKGDAKMISADTHKVTDIPCDRTRFVHRIDSKNSFVWRGEKRIDLADIVNGGNGFGTGRKGYCIMPDTGDFTITDESPLGPDPSGVTKFQLSYMQAVPDLPAVDCVIVPGYEASGNLPLSTTGLSIPDFPEITGSVRWRIQTQPYNKSASVALNGTKYCTNENPAILIHASTGITFDLNRIRQSVPGLDIVSLKSLCGINERAIAGKYDPEKTADVRVYLDGREVFYQSVQHVENNAIPVEIDLTEETARFMTLLVTCGTQSNERDQFVFGDPELILGDR